MDDFFVKIFEDADSDGCSDENRQHLSDLVPPPVRKLLNPEYIPTSEAMAELLDNIYESNQSVHASNIRIVDRYNREVFRFLQSIYESFIGNTVDYATKRRIHLDALQNLGSLELERPTLSAVHIHVLRVLCPQALANALVCIDETYRSPNLSEYSSMRREQEHTVTRFFHPDEYHLWKKNPLLSLFPDRSILLKSMDALRNDGISFIFMPGKPHNEEIFLVSSLAKPRKSRGKKPALDANVPFQKKYACIGGYYCHCEAFYNKVLIGKSNMKDRGTTDSSPQRNSRAHGNSCRDSDNTQIIYERELFCKHALAVQLIIAMESCIERHETLDIRCFFVEYISDEEVSLQPQRISPTNCSFYDCVVVSADQYASILRNNVSNL